MKHNFLFVLFVFSRESYFAHCFVLFISSHLYQIFPLITSPYYFFLLLILNSLYLIYETFDKFYKFSRKIEPQESK